MPKTVTNPVEPLLTPRDVAAVLGVTQRAVEKFRNAGRFPGPDLYVGRLPRWRAETVTGWIDAAGTK